MDYYDKTIWENGDTITADLLNNAESGIVWALSNGNDTLVKLTSFFESIFGGGYSRADTYDYIVSESGGINPSTGEDDDTQENVTRSAAYTVQNGGFYSVYRSAMTKNVRVFVYDGTRLAFSFNSEKGVLFYVNSGQNVRFVDELSMDISGNNFTLERHGYNFEPSKFVLPSSTPGSTKKFQISVNDSGTITATEVQ